MIKFEEAMEIAGRHKINPGTESIGFMDSLGRVLAEDIKSDMDMPPFDKTAVDGYACRRADLNKDLVINEVIAAGSLALSPVKTGECAKIMTGAAVPDGADYVFMVEYAEEKDGRVKFTGKEGKDNIAIKGEDIKQGDIVLKGGRTIKPQDIAVMATVGAVKVSVSCKLKVGIISTGDELVEPDNVPAKGQIRNSNAYQLVAQTIRSGADAHYFGIAPDNEEETFDIVARALDACDIVLLTGGVSMGDYDFVPHVLQLAGVEILFDRVAVQPGKPTTFGLGKNALVFGLPGNPVSSFVQFELFVRPLIQRSMSANWKPESFSIPLAVDYTRKRSERLAFVPVIINDKGEAEPTSYHGSAHINALPDAGGLMKVPLGIKELKKGDKVDVRSI
ncbi:MAG: molybdopterin molybdotransferase MoeA [Bacteroidales bacterium]|nr:molybdopterin molybdotransferase MoeA [Bacteroidales bacterium]